MDGVLQVGQLDAAGVVFVHAVQEAGSLIFVPQGWIVVESVQGNAEVHGCRKSFFHTGSKALLEYKATVALMEASQRPAERHECTSQSI